LSKREGDARGATVYTVSDRASDAEAARLAEKENKADLIAGMDLSAQSEDIVNILYDLTHPTKPAQRIESWWVNAAGLHCATRVRWNRREILRFAVREVVEDVDDVLTLRRQIHACDEVRLVFLSARRAASASEARSETV